jgi:hypothetical protein
MEIAIFLLKKGKKYCIHILINILTGMTKKKDKTPGVIVFARYFKKYKKIPAYI